MTVRITRGESERGRVTGDGTTRAARDHRVGRRDGRVGRRRHRKGACGGRGIYVASSVDRPHPEGVATVKQATVALGRGARRKSGLFWLELALEMTVRITRGKSERGRVTGNGTARAARDHRVG